MVPHPWWRSRAAAYTLIVLVALGVAAALSVRREAAGADAYAYWHWTRAWLDGADPYQLDGAALPYAYAPWALPLFAPWAVLPWELSLALWRGTTVVGLTLSAIWAAHRAPRTTALVLAALAIPIGINLDTGNLTLPITLALFAGLALDHRLAGLVWGVATGTKWITAPLFVLLDRDGRRFGLATLAVALMLSVALLPQTIEQVRIVFSMGRPIPWDYLVLAWAVMPIAIRRGIPSSMSRWLAERGVLRERDRWGARA